MKHIIVSIPIYILIKISDIFKIISDIVKDKIAFKTQSKAEN